MVLLIITLSYLQIPDPLQGCNPSHHYSITQITDHKLSKITSKKISHIINLHGHFSFCFHYRLLLEKMVLEHLLVVSICNTINLPPIFRPVTPPSSPSRSPKQIENSHLSFHVQMHSAECRIIINVYEI